MGIFDVFKTKVSEAAEKASDLMDKKKDTPQAKDARQAAGTPADPGAEGDASNMVSEGAPVSQVGEAAPGVGDDGAPEGGTGTSDGSGGMTQSIKDNVAGGVEKAGQMAKGKTGGKYDDKIDSGVKKAKDMLR